MNLPLYTIVTNDTFIDCYTTEQVKRELYKLGENDIFHRIPYDVQVYLFSYPLCDVSKEFIKR